MTDPIDDPDIKPLSDDGPGGHPPPPPKCAICEGPHATAAHPSGPGTDG